MILQSYHSSSSIHTIQYHYHYHYCTNSLSHLIDPSSSHSLHHHSQCRIPANCKCITHAARAHHRLEGLTIFAAAAQRAIRVSRDLYFHQARTGVAAELQGCHRRISAFFSLGLRSLVPAWSSGCSAPAAKHLKDREGGNSTTGFFANCYA